MFPGLPHFFTRYQDLPSTKRFYEIGVESVRWCLSSEHPAKDNDDGGNDKNKGNLWGWEMEGGRS
jgi:hypothetical protein